MFQRGTALSEVMCRLPHTARGHSRQQLCSGSFCQPRCLQVVNHRTQTPALPALNFAKYVLRFSSASTRVSAISPVKYFESSVRRSTTCLRHSPHLSSLVSSISFRVSLNLYSNCLQYLATASLFALSGHHSQPRYRISFCRACAGARGAI